MASSDDPPFLNVGTEVSAKYRGAFCEATIKIAKKVVKCKISYTKGHTDTVPNDLIKGPLKIGANVEVRQSDGHYLTGIIQKLTDATTYTVVFDDGDERTLKRSSLCLKGGRHYSASESLDQMPLTDPENFGTPAHYQSKRGMRRRRRLSQSSSPEAETQSPRKNPPVSKYPPEYPVGKCVFLENDRRRAGWVPGVIVPAHYVMDESEMNDDTICIRSFKDGRFFAANISELHDFAPDKEPLSSMLVGEIQPMYMCKPAIERAMAYIDTNELPWNMDLFGNNHSLTSVNTNEGSQEEKLTTEQMKEAEDFHSRLNKFQEERGVTLQKKPSLAGKDLDLYKFYNLVKENGGMDKVTQELKWRSLYLQMGIPQFPNSSHLIKQAYKKYLHGFEVYEKARLEGKHTKNKRRSTLQESDEDHTLSATDCNKRLKDANGLSVPSPLSGAETGGEELKEGVALVTFGEYKVGDRVNVWYGKGKAQRTYEAKIIDAEQITPEKVIFYVHYNGWNTRYDEWIETDRLAGKATGPSSRHSGRASYSRKKHGRLKPQQNPTTDTGSPSSSSGGTIGSPVPLPDCYSSGSECGPVKTPKPTIGNTQRRRMSSATETCCSSNSDNPQSPDSVPSSYIPSQHAPNKHPLTKQYPLSPPLASPLPRVPPVLSPDEGLNDTISIRTPPHEDCKDILMDSEETDSELIIKKEENIEYFEQKNVTVEPSSTPSSTDKVEVQEMILNKLKEDHVPPATPPTTEPDSSRLSSNEDTTMDTTREERQQLDAAYSLIQVTSAVLSSSPLSPVSPTAMDQPRPLTPPPHNNQSDNSSINSSSADSDHELSLMMLGTKDSSVSPDGEDSGESPRKRKEGHDSGVENGSESDGPDLKRMARDHLDYSIDMTDLNGLSTSERIGVIVERMKDIQKRYLEFKAEITYLDRKRRRARRREKEGGTCTTKLGPQYSETTPLTTPYSTPPVTNLLPTSHMLPDTDLLQQQLKIPPV